MNFYKFLFWLPVGIGIILLYLFSYFEKGLIFVILITLTIIINYLWVKYFGKKADEYDNKYKEEV